MKVKVSAYARLVRSSDKKLWGYRFSGGYLQPYMDVSLDELSNIWGVSLSQLENFIEKEAHTRELIFDKYSVLTLHTAYGSDMKNISVHDDGTPYRIWNKVIPVHTFLGMKVLLPVGDESKAFKAVDILDNLLYGTSFLEKFSVMSVNNVDICPGQKEGGKFGWELAPWCTATCDCFCSFESQKFSEEDIENLFNDWAKENGIKGVHMFVSKTKKIFHIVLETVVGKPGTPDSVVPFKAHIPEFIKTCALPAPFTQKANPQAWVPEVIYPYKESGVTFTGYVDRNGDMYRFSSREDPSIIGSVASSMSRTANSGRKYLFARSMVINGEVYDVDILRPSQWIVAVLTSNVGHFTAAARSLCENTVLGDILLNYPEDYLPHYRHDGKSGSAYLTFKIDMNGIPADEVMDIIREEWETLMEDWKLWDWRSKLASCKPNVSLNENILDVSLDICLA